MKKFINKTIKKINKDSRRGAALIIALALITFISSAAFSIGRLMISEIRATTGLEDSMVAYYAAEAGVEQGLLMWRYNHDVETSTGATATDGNPVHVDIDEQRSFDLKIYYKGDKVGNFDNIDDPNNPTIKKDGSLELRGFEDVSNLTIKYITPCQNPSLFPAGSVCATNTGRPSGIDHGVEFKIINSDGTQTDLEDNLFDPTASRSGWSPAMLGWTLEPGSKIRVKPWDTDIKYVAETTAITGVPKIDSGISFIESTGYFGSAKRKIQVQVDRVSGTILGTYDFVLFGGSSDIIPK